NHIDLDSTLAPLTQAHKKFNPSPELLDKHVGAAAVSQPFPDSDTDSNEDENGNPLDFSIALENMEELILKFTQSQPTEEEGSRIDFPQVDGSDDLVPKTPTKTGSRLREGNSKNVKTSPCTPRTPSRGNLSPKRSPRTPKSSASKKYAPLPLKITCKKTDKSENKDNEITPVRHSVMRNLDIGSSVSKSAKITLSKKLAITALRRKSVDWSPSTMQQQHISRNEESGSVKRTPIRRSRNTKDLDRTHITCELTPRRKSERILKVYSIEEAVSKEIKPPANQIQSICQNYEPNSVTETSHSNSPRDIKETAGLNTTRKSTRLVDDSRTVSRYSSTTSQIQPGNPCVTERTQSLNIRKCVVKLRRTVIQTNGVSPKNPAAVKKVAGKGGGKEKQITMLKQQQPTNGISIPTGHEYNLKENDAQLWLEENTANPLNESNESDEIAASDIEDDTNSIGAKRLRRSFHLVQRKKMLKNKVVSNNYIHEPAEGVDEINEFSASPTTDVRIDDDYADIDNLHIQSFYDASFTEDLSSPLNYSDGSSHVIDLARQIHSSNQIFREEPINSLECCQRIGHANRAEQKLIATSNINKSNVSPLISEPASSLSEHLVQLTPIHLPPTFDEVLASCVKLDIPEYEFQRPFYGNPDDITQLKEVGHIVLHIPGNPTFLKIAKPRNLVPLSPSVQQRAHMRAPEYLPLILEPQSRFYSDPVIVLDFQSLYPSMIIAYNYCFSTCLGRVEHLGHSPPFEFGASQLGVSPALLRRLVEDDLISISPCGVVFVKASVREGILPRMLSEILNTRQMVKQSMKLDRSNSALQRVLHSRQLGLKLMANVTYGYTAANFSGRMPAVEVGDSVVAKGRETLERAIRMVESNEKWRVRVVYGDTDSLFVQVPGRNRETAFKIGEEIAEAVTKDNPQPVKLKLEKVYQPCILQTKKRYVGYMYETADQTEPVYEAKGIETVRRDGCPAVAKMLEKVLRILFETTDVSQIKQYVCRQFSKLLAGRANLQDLIFAKEFRGLKGYKPTACVPALELTRKWVQSDPRRVPRCGERVPFVIVNGPPGVPLIRLVRSPHEVLEDEGLKINAVYYITKAIIPPLNRCLLLIGADVNEWFASLPRKLLLAPPVSAANKLNSGNYVATAHQPKKSTISQYFSVTNCITDCGRQTKQGICEVCVQQPQRTFVTLHAKMAKIERGYQLVQQICQACCGRVGELNCCSLDCPVLFVSEVKRRDLQQLEHMRSLLDERF
ncbi:PREDICTED: DNA polymerase zeta catalytic subunit-like, partial [Rhagoletis zephyria]|uniref:DNA polymerase zeta catalytic subunit-like n=1 Tax=Rhagoletis zephyria TaxID=28612 RepID=UPI00081167D9